MAKAGRAQKSDIEHDENVHGVAVFSLGKNYFYITRGVPGRKTDEYGDRHGSGKTA